MALYRVVVQGWSKADALREMDEGGFHHSFLWRNLDDYVLKANVETLRRELGVVPPAPAHSTDRRRKSVSLPVPVASAVPAKNPGPNGAPALASNSQ